MSTQSDLIDKLTTLNHIAETLNRAVDVRSVLNDTLANLVKLMGLETGWIFVKNPASQDGVPANGFVLAAHHNLPPALALDSPDAWSHSCDCQKQCTEECMTKAYNEMSCGRLENVPGDRRGLAMHASAPLRSGNRILGILNVAAPDWSSFSSESLALLTNIGNQIGIALERARLFDLVQEQRLREQAALLDFSNQLLSRRDLGELLDYLVQDIAKMLRVDACALLLPGDNPDLLDFRAASGWRMDPKLSGYQAPANEESSPGLVMHTQEPLLVQDIAEDDPTPWQPDWLQVEKFRGHAAMPLITSGRSVGALVINTRTPLAFSKDEIRLLRLMANQAAIAIEEARLHREEARGQQMEKELTAGQQIQLSLLPKELPVMPGWEFATFYKAARLVGGDFYDFFELPGEPQKLGIVIADVVGKGVPAALYMTLCRTVIRTTALNGGSPSAVLARANELILKESDSDLFLTAFYATLDINSGRLVHTSAGHNPPLWLQRASGTIQELSTRGIVLGAFPGIELGEGEVNVAPGDQLVFYTDGVTEAMNPQRQLFGEERLHATVAKEMAGSALHIVNAVVDAVDAHATDASQSDDLTLFVARRLERA